MNQQVIYSAFEKIIATKTEDLTIHFICDGFIDKGTIRHNILDGMKKYGITSVMVTTLIMMKWHLITKESMESYCKGKEDHKVSVNDDLESFFEDIRLNKEPEYQEPVVAYFLPMLTKRELKLVASKDSNYLATFAGDNPDVPKAEMEASESDSKYVHAFCRRETFTLNLTKTLKSQSYSN